MSQALADLALGHVEDIGRLFDRHVRPEDLENLVAGDHRMIDEEVEQVARAKPSQLVTGRPSCRRAHPTAPALRFVPGRDLPHKYRRLALPRCHHATLPACSSRSGLQVEQGALIGPDMAGQHPPARGRTIGRLVWFENVEGPAAACRDRIAARVGAQRLGEVFG